MAETSSAASPAKARTVKWLAAAAVAALAVGLAAWAQLGARQTQASAMSFKVIAAYPHDPNAFTQGLAIVGGQLYEGTGIYGASTLRRVDFKTGRVDKQRALARNYFGEGIAILGKRILQLTWQNGIGIVYDLDTFAVERTFEYEGEGWGLTHDGKHLILSDGSATLRFLDPETFAVVRTVEVRDGGKPIDRLNELEYVDGEVWSNIWYDDRIARISPADGKVLGYLDLSALYPQSARSSEAVLNGIAYDPDSDTFLITGKLWPWLFEVRFVPAS